MMGAGGCLRVVAVDVGGTLGQQGRGRGTQAGHLPPPEKAQGSQGHCGSPSPGTGHIAGHWGGTRLDWDMSLQVMFMFHINRGLPWAFLCSICSREQERNKLEGAQLES